MKVQRAVTAFFVISIILVAFLSYRDVPGYFFTSADTLPLIDTGRIQSFGDVERVLTEPLMNGTEFTEQAVFYRPVITFLFGLEYAMWGLNPFGYHLTNLVLHALVSVLVFFLAWSLAKGREVYAWLGAMLFTLHPLHVTLVPAPGWRHDIVAVFFMLLSLLLFLKHLSSSSRKSRKNVYMVLSIFFCVLALGSKEVAFILAPLIFAYLMITTYSNGSSFKEAAVRALRGSVPHLTATIVVFAWRAYILGGIGGYHGKSFEVLQSVKILRRYIVSLLHHPFDLPALFFDPLPGTPERVFSLAALLLLFALLFIYRRAVSEALFRDGRGVAGVIFAAILVLSLAAILAYPLVSAHISHLVESIYNGEARGYVLGTVELSKRYPVEHHLLGTRNVILSSLYILMFVAATCLVKVRAGAGLRAFFIRPSDPPLMLFLLVWLALPLGIYMLTDIFSYREMYIPAIPFCMGLALMLGDGYEHTVRSIKERKTFRLEPAVFGFVVMAGLAITLVLFSPLVATHGQWKDHEKISRIFFDKLSVVVSEAREDATLHVYDFPGNFISYRNRVPRGKSIPTLAAITIKSWLDLYHPGNRMKVYLHSVNRTLPACPDKMTLDVSTEGNDVSVYVRVDCDGA